MSDEAQQVSETPVPPAPPPFTPIEPREGARWAHVEVYGHRQYDGRIYEVPQFGCVMARIEVYCRDGHLIGAVEQAGASLFSITDLDGGEKQARERVGVRLCGHPDHDSEKAAKQLAAAGHTYVEYDPGHGPPDSDDDVPC